ncbi:DUF3078 domain-containing protein [Capnocytophaga granulosa]|uniref:DUF3078 domain-containing protein n=1 Tax=Capnocytophaga granulosa TaxID=45242 RepID=UPI0023F210F7|nr:DUF3078 domain-containing protein [Capnocytophaga granulosa]
MKKLLLGIIILSFALPLQAQVRKVRPKVMPPIIQVKEVDFSKNELSYTFEKLKLQNEHWYKFNSVGLNMSEVAYSNWNAGGVNSITFLADVKFRRRYLVKNYFWDNELVANYGINAQKGESLRKTDDQVTFTSSYGYRTGFRDWYYSSKLTFNTQFSDGYDYPREADDEPISRFMAPGYLYISIGAEYAPQNGKTALFVSPLTLKSTFVMDQKLADKGSFGLPIAEYDNTGRLIKHSPRSLTRVGFLVSGKHEMDIYENVKMTNQASLYTQYDKSFGNIDIDWQMSIDMKINNYLQARVGTHLKYDDDIKFKEEILPNGAKHLYSPRVQFKQILGIGIKYTF